jgi:hypothetical protein
MDCSGHLKARNPKRRSVEGGRRDQGRPFADLWRARRTHAAPAALCIDCRFARRRRTDGSTGRRTMADKEREIIYTDGGRRGGSTALIVVVVLAILVVLFLVFGRGYLDGRANKTVKADVDVHAPASGGSNN